MARSREREQQPVVPRSIQPAKSIELLKTQQDRGRELLKSKPVTEEQMRHWEQVTKEIIVRAFGQPSERPREFEWAGHSAFGVVGEWTDLDEERTKELTSKIDFINTLIEVLQLDISLGTSSASDGGKAPPTSIPSAVFLVHGHNEKIKESVARFIRKMDIEPIILHEKPDKGRTIIEKLEDEHLSALVAIVLITADDVGAAKDQAAQLLPRARQNVIFELGFFLGKFGRRRTIVLHEPKVELPSDYHGVIYIPLDGDSWMLRLMKEMKAAGLAIDANKALA